MKNNRISPDSGTDENDKLIAWLETQEQDKEFESLEDEPINDEDSSSCSPIGCEMYKECGTCPFSN